MLALRDKADHDLAGLFSGAHIEVTELLHRNPCDLFGDESGDVVQHGQLQEAAALRHDDIMAVGGVVAHFFALDGVGDLVAVAADPAVTHTFRDLGFKAGAAECRADERALELAFVGVIYAGKGAAAASFCRGTFGLDAMGRSFEHSFNARDQIVARGLDYFDLQLVSGHSAGDEHDHPVDAGDAVSEVIYVGDADLVQ